MMFLKVTIDSGLEVAINTNSIIDMSPSVNDGVTFIIIEDEAYIAMHEFDVLLDSLRYAKKNNEAIASPEINLDAKKPKDVVYRTVN